MKKPIAALLAATALSSLPSAHAAFAWASAGVSLSDYQLSAGLQLLPLPFIGSFGLEGSLERPWNADRTDFAVAATVRDVRLPLTTVDLFASGGMRFRQSGQDPYLEGGFRTDFTDFVNAVGLRGAFRFYPNDASTRIGLGLEVRF